MRLETAERIEKLHIPSKEGVLNVVVFGSGSGTNLSALLQAQKQGGKFKIQAIVCDRRCRCCEIAAQEDIPLIYLSYLTFKQQHDGMSPLALRMQYEEEIIFLIEQLAAEKAFSVDLIFLAGYMRIVTATLLERYPNKVVNVHPADLSVTDAKGHRIYVGANAVYEALLAGEKATRSCVILVDHGVDTGPVIATGPTVLYTDEQPVTKESAARHQEKQKRESDWPVAVKAVALISEGAVGIDENRIIYIDGHPQGALGYDQTKHLG